MECGTFLWNDGWSFRETELNSALDDIQKEKNAFEAVGIPHDWLIYHAENLYQDGCGWYRKLFLYEKNEEQTVSVLFDGVYMDSRIYVNGALAGEWKYGYSAFEIDMTPFLKEGENEIFVQVTHRAPNSRWYSGAGIFRNVHLVIRRKEAQIPNGGNYIRTREMKNGWELLVDTEVKIPALLGAEQKTILESDGYRMTYSLNGYRTNERFQTCLNAENGEQKPLAEWSVKTAELESVPLSDGEQAFYFKSSVHLDEVCIWDAGKPYLYQVTAQLWKENDLLQTETETIGFRTIEFTPEEGFLLNHRKLKLRGVCEHHDLGCLGAAYNQEAMRRKVRILMEMGVNALRTSHNMPAKELMELADETGLLIMSEAFDMWERSKTTYDYGRFFKEWQKKDVCSWIRRDRNHASVILWSIGNEIYDTHVDAHGEEITRMLMEEVLALDPEQHAHVTMGSNYMPWEHAQKCADIVKLIGYNYSEGYYEAHHKAHPDWIIYGSETASTVQSRGIYHFPHRQAVLADEDEQCSALGNSTTSWGARNSEFCVKAERDMAFSCGQFLWTGFDYIGEPTPYHTKNSYFGQIDTAGFPKDSYYIYQAEWTDYKQAPMVHVFPYWSFNEGQLVDVRVCSNAPVVELFVNGESQGETIIDHAAGENLTADYSIPYKSGVLRAIAKDENGTVIAEDVRHSFGEAAKIVLAVERSEIYTDGRDLAFLTISMEDADGYPVENAVNRVQVLVEGAGYLAGLDNGDSTDPEGYKQNSRRLFSGKLLAVIAAGTAAGEIRVKVCSEGLEPACLTLTAVTAERKEGTGEGMYRCLPEQTEENQNAKQQHEIPVRAIRLSSETGMCLTPECPQTMVRAQILPEQADDQEVLFAAVNDAGIPSNIASVEQKGTNAVVSALGDGSFNLRCMSKSGTGHIRVISQLNFTVNGMGPAFIDPYEFVSGGLYTYSKGKVGNGNEHGFATARDGETQVGFRNLDFGDFGSDEITIPVFALDGAPYQIQIWEGMPEEDGSEIIADVVYQKPSIWNVYQEETYHLNKRLHGIRSICFVLKDQKVHIKGFLFARQEKAFARLDAAGCSRVYGDAFEVKAPAICSIGNNVTIEFEGMNFGENGTSVLTIAGNTPLEENTIHVRFLSEETGEARKEIVEFSGTGEEAQTFQIPKVTGKQKVSFVFLPGSQFDFLWFQFQ